MVNVGAKHSLTVIKYWFALCFRCLTHGAMPSQYTIPDYSQPPRSRNSPTLPALARSCNRVSQHQPSTYRIGLSKSKNPAKCSVVLALGESNNKTIDVTQKTRLLYDKTTQNSTGFSQVTSTPSCHTRQRYCTTANNKVSINLLGYQCPTGYLSMLTGSRIVSQ
jgi:hypothetical protein